MACAAPPPASGTRLVRARPPPPRAQPRRRLKRPSHIRPPLSSALPRRRLTHPSSFPSRSLQVLPWTRCSSPPATPSRASTWRTASSAVTARRWWTADSSPPSAARSSASTSSSPSAPLRSRYVPETGDVVLGRVTEIAGKRWKLDVNARQDAVLQLSAVHLPGGVQRRNAVDELNMRRLYGEDDLVSAEVQSFYADGAVALHTRSLKYGRLSRGQLVRVPPTLVKRVKQHFHRLDPAECGGADRRSALGV